MNSKQRISNYQQIKQESFIEITTNRQQSGYILIRPIINRFAIILNKALDFNIEGLLLIGQSKEQMFLSAPPILYL